MSIGFSRHPEGEEGGCCSMNLNEKISLSSPYIPQKTTDKDFPFKQVSY